MLGAGEPPPSAIPRVAAQQGPKVTMGACPRLAPTCFPRSAPTVARFVDAVRRHHGLDVWVFGSVARGDESAESDVDFLVRFAPGSPRLDLMRLQDELAELLGRPVMSSPQAP